jgi:hypothetical protein
MKPISLYTVVLSVLLATSCSMSFAAAPPPNPPSPPPITSVYKLVGTWEGVLYDARQSGYSNSSSTDKLVLKITDQWGTLFRGYSKTPDSYGGGGVWLFAVGTIENDGTINVVQKDNSGYHSIWRGKLWGSGMANNPRIITFHILNPVTPNANVVTLTKTTP